MKYPLLSNAFNKNDIDSGIKVLKSKFITMSKITEKFEKKFAKKVGAKYALMTNSGSSANLLALSAISNPLYRNKLKFGDEVLIPSVCWSTSLWPIVQNNLKPVFVDIELETLNMSFESLKKKITKRTKAILCVHILGTSMNMLKLKNFANKNNLLIIEDTCESLGAKFRNKSLGTFGNFGSFSFYYSHQITSGEGGMIVCNNKDDYNLIKSLRSHGWARNIKLNDNFLKRYKNLDNRFLFINSGYNLRPTEIQAAIANSQFKRLGKFMSTRDRNRNLIIQSLKNNRYWKNQFKFVSTTKYMRPSWFGLSLLINEKYRNKKKKFLEFLTKNGIENRPILSGNFLNQPSIKLYNLNKNNIKFKNAQIAEDLGFFIGLHTDQIKPKMVKFITDNLLYIDQI